MIKRVILTSLLIVAFVIFYKFIPFEFYSKAPLLLNVIFSIITGTLLLSALLNISSIKEYKNISKNNKPVEALLISTFSIILFFLIYYFNYIDIVQNEFKYNSVQTEALLIDKWSEKKIIRFNAQISIHLKIKYKVENRYITSQHITDGKTLDELPINGESLIISYTKKNPSIFRTSWESERANYDPKKDPEQIRINKIFDSLVPKE